MILEIICGNKYSEILKANARKISGKKILRKYGVKYFLTFEDNLRIKGFENFEKIYTYSENLQNF